MNTDALGFVGHRVLVAMSGGVDSAVAAALLRDEGHEVAGVTFRLFCHGEQEAARRACCGLEGIRDAQSTARRLGIAHFVLDLETLFRERVVGDFTAEYAAGRTPNPCVECNTHVKFGPLRTWAQENGFDRIATGHYARVVRARGGGAGERCLIANGDDEGERCLIANGGNDGKRYLIARGADPAKDQSYVLWGVPADVLPFTMLPLGGLSKDDVRARARDLGLPVWDRVESQDICFVAGRDYTEVLRLRLGPEHAAFAPGEIVDESGRLLGHHRGLARYTVGQRHALGLSGPESFRVLALVPETNTLVVGAAARLDRGGLTASRLHFFVPPAEVARAPVAVKIRYRHEAAAAEARVEGDRLHVRFQEPQRGITPGQSCVVYRDGFVLGGGRIEGPCGCCTP
jgi:tRNA-specific 2-thiouridylase